MVNISKVKVVDKSKGMEDNIKVLDNTKYAPSLSVLCFWLCFATYLLMVSNMWHLHMIAKVLRAAIC